jgi:hypothetical protein
VTDDTRPTDPFRPAPSPSAPAGAAPSGSNPSGSSPFGPPPASPGASVTPGAAFAPAPVQPAAPAPVPAKPRRSGASTFVNVLLGVALVVAVGGVAFAAGRATAPETANAGTGRFGNGGNFAFGPGASGAPDRQFGGGFGGGNAGITIEGTVTAVAADSITLQLASGQTVTIPTTSSTTYHSQASASPSDVTSGTKVKVDLTGGGFVRNGNGGNGNGNGGNGNGGNGGPQASGVPNANGAPNRGLGSANSITVVPAGS